MTLPGLIDSHCHLDGEPFDADRDAAIQRALDAGVELMMCIGTGGGPPDYEAGIRLADKYAPVYATVGVHPHEAAKADGDSIAAMEKLLRHPKVLAIGEMGLDYHYDYSPRETQRDVFVSQLQLARRAAKPIVIHTREAWDDTLRILEEHWTLPNPGGIMHCFSGGVAEARRCLDMGFHLSFAGVVTFPKATDLHAAAKEAPLDRILVETDAPYLAPVPMRGKRNEPSFVIHTAHRLASLRGETPETIARATSANFRALCRMG
ncbi:MAG: TatD family hydrolase [Candidatus Solibacter usitatus]|nr:TatD family hydrolase [Candidatus Solibacter usitatus]